MSIKLTPFAEGLVALWGANEHKLVSFGQEALTCERVAAIAEISMDSIGKAMMTVVDKRSILVVIPGDKRLDEEALKLVFKAKKAKLMQKNAIEKLGLTVGAVTPLICLQRGDISCAIDSSLLDKDVINISTGDPAVGMNISPSALKDVLNAQDGKLTA